MWLLLWEPGVEALGLSLGLSSLRLCLLLLLLLKHELLLEELLLERVEVLLLLVIGLLGELSGILMLLLLLLLLLEMVVSLRGVHRENGVRLISIITMHNYAFHPITLLLHHISVLNAVDEVVVGMFDGFEQTWLITASGGAGRQHPLLVFIAFLTLSKLAADFRHTARIVVTLTTESCDKVCALGLHTG